MRAAWGWGDSLTPSLLCSTRARTLHDVVPISCLAEFPNVVQMAKVGATLPPSDTQGCPPAPGPPWQHPFFPQLVCEDVNVDRFYPVLYPKVNGVQGGDTWAPMGAPPQLLTPPHSAGIPPHPCL